MVTAMPEQEELELFEGAVALTDALGFRNAARNDPSGVVRTIAATRAASSHATQMNNIQGEVHIEYAAVSDTIILAASQRDYHDLSNVIVSVAEGVVSQITAAAFADKPLAYRGCIATGPLAIVENDLFVGGAIDEAAAWYERAQAAIVWLTPAAKAVLDGKENEHGPLFVDHRLQIKDVGHVSVKAVNPFYAVARQQLWTAPSDATLNEGELQRYYAALLAPLQTSTSLDVVLKMQNTLQFLGEAQAAARQRWKWWTRREAAERGEVEMRAGSRVPRS